MTRLTSAQRALVEEHLTLVDGVVARFLLTFPTARHLREDLVQEGRLALVSAATAFDPARGVQFSSYAWHRILGVLRRAEHGDSTPTSGGRCKNVRVPRGEMPIELGAPPPDATVATDAIRLMKRFTRMLGGRGNGKRNADIFIRLRVLERHDDNEGLRARYGISRQALHQICNAAQPKFEQLAAELRAEVA